MAGVRRPLRSGGHAVYLDPPYWGSETDYGQGMFGRNDFAAVVNVLRTLRGKFVLSINYRPEVRELFAGFDVREVELTYSVSERGGTKARELIVTSLSDA